MLRFMWMLVLVLNVGTLAVYGYDKWQSRRDGAWRVRESTLLWCLWLGGAVGAWLAMTWFRHKTRKQPFHRWAILWTLLNPVWLLVWWTWRTLGR